MRTEKGNPYFIFRKEERDYYWNKYPNYSSKEMMSVLAQAWNDIKKNHPEKYERYKNLALMQKKADKDAAPEYMDEVSVFGSDRSEEDEEADDDHNTNTLTRSSSSSKTKASSSSKKHKAPTTSGSRKKSGSSKSSHASASSSSSSGTEVESTTSASKKSTKRRTTNQDAESISDLRRVTLHSEEAIDLHKQLKKTLGQYHVCRISPDNSMMLLRLNK